MNVIKEKKKLKKYRHIRLVVHLSTELSAKKCHGHWTGNIQIIQIMA